MLYWLEQYADTPLRIFKYLTFRSAGAGFTAMMIVILFGPLAVRLLKKYGTAIPQDVKGYISDAERSALKDKTPSMGGLLIVAGILVSTFLWARIDEMIVILFMGSTALFCLVGFLDDRGKMLSNISGSGDGLSEKAKALLLVGICIASAYFVTQIPGAQEHSRDFMVPFLKHPVLRNLPFALILAFSTAVIWCTSNAVNITDGLDGLATGCMIPATGCFVIIAYLCGNFKYADYLSIPYIEGCGEVCVFGAAMIGACIGFLWHNCHPASMFMGDTGSLPLGGAIGLIAVLVKQELLVIIVGGVFVWEAASSFIQRYYFKYTRKKYGEGRRLLRKAPIHHHYQQIGWHETQIVVRFWIIGCVLAAFALATLKLR